ncbi:programmed cell death protein 2-like [Phalaenopsis equestris]|uniref:programmed cell death protein 2-like n=1 Tax=Phalaenopsis equestris TaxID=78828 RepID=UPI0009E1AAD5|nr:programmed cell death protein 2-like [Phalaenopsis equestris]XP_020571331.1 programmed cell death protein 2-like [Phalaenopsis equestris]
MGGVVLGMPGPWAENFLEKSDHYTTKIGGLPDWPFPEMFLRPDLIKCVLCGERLCLLAQVYAPIKLPKLNVDERVIYVFGCLTKKCGSSPKCWRALRMRKCNSEKTLNGICEDSKPSANCNGDEKNMVRGNDGSVEKNLVSGDEESVEEEYDDLYFDELARELSEACSQASRSKKPNGSLILGSNKTSMRSESTLNGINSSIPVVPCFYIYTQEDRSVGEVAAVCANYAKLSVKQEDDSNNDKDDEVWEGEGYEYDKALGADRTFLKFKKRMDAYPEQCFRYSYGGKPLLVKTDLEEPNPCNLCGSPRQYEMQLMPSLLYFLHEAADGSLTCMPDEWNWMTMLVYTCSSNCCPHSCAEEPGNCCWAVAEEVIIIQDD